MQDGKSLIFKTIKKYTAKWVEQDKIFKTLGENNPYTNPKFINLNKLSSNERDLLIELSVKTESEVFRKIHEKIGEKFYQVQSKKISIVNASKKLNVRIYKKIPFIKTISFREFYFALPTGITNPHLSIEEFKWLYSRGYFPHLYWNNGQPRFDRRMWFIVDFVLRECREKIGLGIFKKINNWLPSWYLLSNYIELTTFMFNSWNIGLAILKYSEKVAKKSKQKGENFGLIERGIKDDLWINEGKVLALDLIEKTAIFSKHQFLLNFYRDTFALLAFDAFPGNYLIDMYHNRNLRGAVMLHLEPFMKLRTYNSGYLNANTYSKDDLSTHYDLLFAAMDWALSMRDGVKRRSVAEIVNNYRDKNTENKIPCRICGDLFIPKRKIDITCGKRTCVIKNKYLSKRKKTNNKIFTNSEVLP